MIQGLVLYARARDLWALVICRLEGETVFAEALKVIAAGSKGWRAGYLGRVPPFLEMSRSSAGGSYRWSCFIVRR